MPKGFGLLITVVTRLWGILRLPILLAEQTVHSGVEITLYLKPSNILPEKRNLYVIETDY